MYIKVLTEIFLEVEDEEEGEIASGTLNSGLAYLLTSSGFPHGEVLGAEVDHFSEVDQEVIEKLGYL